MAISDITNGELGSSVRTKLNTIIEWVNKLINGDYKKTSDEASTLDFGTNQATWAFGADAKQSARWEAILTANTTVSFTGDAALSTQIGRLTVSNSGTALTISDADTWNCNALPADGSVAWDASAQKLTFTPPGAGTVYKLYADRDVDGDWDFTIVARNTDDL